MTFCLLILSVTLAAFGFRKDRKIHLAFVGLLSLFVAASIFSISDAITYDHAALKKTLVETLVDPPYGGLHDPAVLMRGVEGRNSRGDIYECARYVLDALSEEDARIRGVISRYYLSIFLATSCFVFHLCRYLYGRSIEEKMLPSPN